MRVVILLSLCLAVAIAAPSNPQRIVGGTVTSIDRYPYAAVLLYSWSGLGNFGQSCGGAIINNRSILSAAHCFAGDVAAQWRVRVGSTNAHSGGVVHQTSRLINHPQYNHNSRTYDNDIAILQVTSAFIYNNNVQPGRIADHNYNLLDNQAVWAIGWGRTTFGGAPSEQLRHVQIWTVNQNTCRNRYALIRPITDNMLCSGWLDVGGRDQCQGDSGGPLLHGTTIVGVCSWGEGCAERYYPGVNARVSRYTSWIQSNA
ncbi:unnamed protein product, partial [Brenthis ino]